MAILGYEDILVIMFFIFPGYIVLYTISIFTDYLYEDNSLDRIIHYLFFSFFLLLFVCHNFNFCFAYFRVYRLSISY